MRYRNYSLLTALVHLVWLTQCSHAGVLGFDIQLTFSGLTTSQQAVFQSAAQAWESRLIGYQDTVASNIVQINATGITIDGAGGILGSAGPTFGKASSPECVGDFWGRQLPKCMQQCDFRHVERL